MKRALQIIAILLVASGAFAATPGYTAAERARANEFVKRIASRGVADKLVGDYGRTYLRRSYVVSIDPAETLAVDLLSITGLTTPDQLQYFAWGLEALVRGAALEDVRATVTYVTKNCYGADRAFYMQNLLAAGSEYVSIAPLLAMIKKAENNGLVGKRKQDFALWLVATIQNGEDPAILARLFNAVSDTVIGGAAQVDYLQRFNTAVRTGIPPTELVVVVDRVSQNTATPKQFEEKYQKILALYYGGTPMLEAIEKVFPPKKEKEPIRSGY